MNFEQFEETKCKDCPMAKLCHEKCEPQCIEGEKIWCNDQKEINKDTKGLDYSILCPRYYSSYEDGLCMETCEFYNRDECPVIYAEEFFAEKNYEIEVLEKTLKQISETLIRAENEIMGFNFMCVDENDINEKIDYFKRLAEKQIKGENDDN